MEVVTEFELYGKKIEIQKQDNGLYDVLVDGENKQPEHDADGIIRYLSHALQNLSYKFEKIKNH